MCGNTLWGNTMWQTLVGFFVILMSNQNCWKNLIILGMSGYHAIEPLLLMSPWVLLCFKQLNVSLLINMYLFIILKKSKIKGNKNNYTMKL